MVRLLAEVERLLQQVDDRANAERVLGRVAAEATRDEREELRRSALAELQGEQERERELVARMLSEAITAVERLLESGGPALLADLSRRFRELASGLRLTVKGNVGEVVTIDTSVHETSGQGGLLGEVRRVGVADERGRLIVRPAVIPSPRLV